MASKLAQLREITTVVADTGDLDAIAKYRPVDATTNPSLLLNAVGNPNYTPLVEHSLRESNAQSTTDWEAAAEHLAVAAGVEVLRLIPGRVSTEVCAKFSHDTQATIDAALRLIDLYAQQEVAADRVLIKIAATWEGIQAAKALEARGVQCNLTLLFSFEQAQACADVGVYLISPFVGRITDWYKAQSGVSGYEPAEDPGVQSVQRIYNHYKQCGYNTVVMGASFRNVGQVEELAGCDRLTISPALLDELEQDRGVLERKLDAALLSSTDTPAPLQEAAFADALAANAMAAEKLADGIARFVADHDKLLSVLAQP